MSLRILKRIGLVLGVLFLANVVLNIALITFGTIQNEKHKAIAESRIRPAVAFFQQQQIDNVFLQTAKVYVRSPDEDESWFSMRGYLYEGKIFITNNHVYTNACPDGCKETLIRITNEYDARASGIDQKKIGFSALFCHERLDICAVDIAPGKSFQRKPVASDSKQIYVAALSSSTGDFSIAPGTISLPDSPAIIADLFVKPGYSGSPAFNSAGEAIAILSRGLGFVGIDSEPYMSETVAIRLEPILDLTECHLLRNNCEDLVRRIEKSMDAQSDSYRHLNILPLATFFDRLTRWYRYRNIFETKDWESQ